MQILCTQHVSAVGALWTNMSLELYFFFFYISYKIKCLQSCSSSDPTELNPPKPPVCGLFTCQKRSPTTHRHPNTPVITARWVRDSHLPVILGCMCLCVCVCVCARVCQWCGWLLGGCSLVLSGKMFENRTEGWDVGGKTAYIDL